MNLSLVQYRKKFNFYNTTTCRFEHDQALSLEELQQITQEREGSQGLAALPDRIKRSSDEGRLRDLLFCNRAGEYGQHLTFDECIEFFLT